jgi:CheY-like chemotaxis protein
MEDTKKIKIMIVDDDKFLLDMYSRKFSQNNYDVAVCVGADDCLEKLKSGYIPDILVLDLIMPKMDGLSLFKKIQSEKLSPKSKNIILTNQGQQSDLDKVKDLGIDGYIIKALHTPSEVVEKIKEIFNK